MNLKTLQEKLKWQVQKEYNLWYNHIRAERDRKRNIIDKVLDPSLPEWQVRVNLLWKNIQLELALFLTDDIGVKYLSSGWVIDDEIMKNANLVAKYDDMDMNLREQRETIVNQNALYGLSCTVIDAWDDFEKQPISDVLDPLNIIIDPENYTGSKMRFFGVNRRVSREWLETTEGFEGVKELDFSTIQELSRTKRANDQANNLGTIESTDEWMCDIYDHFTIYDGKKWLTTWANERSNLIRAIEIEPLTESEKRKPTKVKFPIQLHRRKPKYGSVFGVSIADEILQFQDAISILTNLQLIQARNLALWPDVFVDERLGIDTELLSQRKPWGRIIPISNDANIPTQNGIFQQQLPNPSNYVDWMIQSLEWRAEWTTTVNQQSFGVSQSGSQTKAEIQTLQQNANQILIWISNNYLAGQKEYWEAHYRSYCLNFGKGKKVVSLYQKGSAIAESFSRSDFIADGKVSVFITSKSQDAIENDKEFNKLLSIAELYLQNMKPWYSLNDFLRTLGKKTNIREFDEYRYVPESVDEMNAKKNLALLNLNIKVPWPKVWEDFMTYILIYRQAMETDAKREALEQYEQAYMKLQKPQEAQLPSWQWSSAVTGIAMNNVNQMAQTSPSTSMVTQ